MDRGEFRKSATALRQLWVLGNQYLTEAAPWTALKTDPARGLKAVEPLVSAAPTTTVCDSTRLRSWPKASRLRG